MVARSRQGDTRPFPVAETKHKNSILLTTEVPANVSYRVLEDARSLALDVVGLLDGRCLCRVLCMACERAQAELLANPAGARQRQLPSAGGRTHPGP